MVLVFEGDRLFWGWVLVGEGKQQDTPTIFLDGSLKPTIIWVGISREATEN